MSADNGVYILETTDRQKHINEFSTERVDNGISAYRVAHAQGIDDLEWYESFEPYNIGFYMHEIFGKSKVYYSFEEALNKAQDIENKIGYTEYGIRSIDASMYSFPS